VNPDEVSRKSLRVLDKKLRLPGRARRLSYQHHSSSAADSSSRKMLLTVAKRATELGFSTTVGVIHDGDGTLKPLTEAEKKFFMR